VAYFKLLSQHLPGGPRKITETPKQAILAEGPKSNPRPSERKVELFNHYPRFR